MQEASTFTEYSHRTRSINHNAYTRSKEKNVDEHKTTMMDSSHLHSILPLSRHFRSVNFRFIFCLLHRIWIGLFLYVCAVSNQFDCSEHMFVRVCVCVCPRAYAKFYYHIAPHAYSKLVAASYCTLTHFVIVLESNLE